MYRSFVKSCGLCWLTLAHLSLNIKCSKSELVRLGEWANTERLIKVLGCKVDKLLIKYLSMPLGAKYKDVRT